MRCHVVTGKGGTGKTTVAAALALSLAADGRHVGGDRGGDGGQPDAELGEPGGPGLGALGCAGRCAHQFDGRFR